CRRRATVGSASFASPCGHRLRYAGSTVASLISLIAPSMPSCVLERWSTMQHDPGIDDEEHHRLFMLLLRAATASRMRDDDFARQQEIAATLTEDDMSDRAAVARGATLLHRAWG